MQSPHDTFDLVLSYPQWQGSGRHENLRRGAEAAAEICRHYGPLQVVPFGGEGSDGHKIRRWSAIFDQFCSAQDMLVSRGPRRVLTAGGDCAVDVAVIDYLNRLHPELTVVWVDTHLDANTPDTSPSGMFHAMPVTAIMGHAPEPMRRRMEAPLDPSQFRYFGVRIGDEADWAFQGENDLRTLGPQEELRGPVHIHFDLDVLDPGEFPYLAYPEPGGVSVDEAVALVHRIGQQADVVGLTITEFAPADDNEAREGSMVIRRLCDALARKVV